MFTSITSKIALAKGSIQKVVGWFVVFAVLSFGIHLTATFIAGITVMTWAVISCAAAIVCVAPIGAIKLAIKTFIANSLTKCFTFSKTFAARFSTKSTSND